MELPKTVPATVRKVMKQCWAQEAAEQVKDLGDMSDFDDYYTIRLALDTSIECATFFNLIQPGGKRISY